MDDKTLELLMECCPFDWPGNSIVDLDDFGDCGYYLEEFVLSDGYLCLLDKSVDLEGDAAILTETYLQAQESNGMPFDFSFFESKEEAIKIIQNDFKAFLTCWRKRVQIRMQKTT